MSMSDTPSETGLWAGVIVADLVSLIPVLAAAYGAVLGAVVLTTGWQWFTDRTPRRHRRRAVTRPVAATGQDHKATR